MGRSIHAYAKLQLLIALCLFDFQVSLSPWKFKGESVLAYSPSSVDMMLFLVTQPGYIMGQQRRVVNSLPQPSLS